MNKKLPFEEAFERQMNNLQSSNEDESWQKMKTLLDEKDKRKPVAFFTTYKAIIVLILLLVSGFWYFTAEKNVRKEEPVTAAEKTIIDQQVLNKNKVSKAPAPVTLTQQKTAKIAKVIQGDRQGNNLPKAPPVVSNSTVKTQIKTSLKKDKTINSFLSKNKTKATESEVKDLAQSTQSTTTKVDVAETANSAGANENKAAGLPQALAVSAEQKGENDSITSNEKIKKDTLSASLKENLIAKENTVSKQSAGIGKVPVKAIAKYVLSAGIGVQQQIPLAGQKTVAYGYNGTSSTISDYIPSVYVKLEKDQKWFLQGEFIYASPQLIKAVAYDKQTHANNNTSTITTTTFRLKKTYYNEAPLSFNYYIRPQWYAGIGGVYSWFHGAIAEKEILTNNVLTQTQSVAKQIVPISGYTDSFLYKTHTYLLLQTGYNLGRLSAGLRYTKDVQPYIKYTLPDGTINDDKSWSLEFILRFRLFKAARF